MSGWLLDTNVVSALAPGRSKVPAHVAEWLEARSDELFLSAVTAAEIGAGIAKLRRSGALARAAALTEWFERILEFYGDRVLPLDLPAGRIAGDIIDSALGRGHTPGFADAAIAAIAKARDLTVVTANLRHFEPLGVTALDPFGPRALPTA